MTEHNKIPVPQQGVAATRKQSLIERVAGDFDVANLSPAPIPSDLALPASRRGRRYRRIGDEREEVPVPAVDADGPGVEASQSATPLEVPIRFTGEHHSIDRRHLREQGLIVPEGAVTGIIEEFRIVKRQLLRKVEELRREGIGAAAQRILICSPHAGEGKTSTAVNLALAIAAEKESEVVLVDADFAKPSVLTALGLPGGPGLMDALADPHVDVASCVIGTDVPGLWVLPSGSPTNSDTEHLSASHSRAVLDRLTQGAPRRIVILDSPPVLAATPAVELARYVGQAVVVVRADSTGLGAIEDAVSLISACPSIELLLNAVQFSPSGRRFGSYYGYDG